MKEKWGPGTQPPENFGTTPFQFKRNALFDAEEAEEQTCAFAVCSSAEEQTSKGHVCSSAEKGRGLDPEDTSSCAPDRNRKRVVGEFQI